jgi:hypothetical protein
MISEKTIRLFMESVFLNPQKILGGLEGERKLEDVHLIFIKLLSGDPIKGRGTKLDPVFLKIGFTNVPEEITNLKEEDLNFLIKNLKQFDTTIGSWTLVHDMPATKDYPQWRLSSEICPRSAQSANIELTEEDKPRKILCVDFEGVGIFMGKPEQEEK